MKTKLAFLIIILISIILPEIGKAQTALEIVWQKEDLIHNFDYAKLSADGKFVYGAYGPNIYKFSTENGEYLSTFKNKLANATRNFKISKSGKYIATMDGKGHCFIWDVEKEQCLSEVKLPKQKDNEYLGTAVFLDNDSLIVVIEIYEESLNTTYSRLVKYNWINSKELNSTQYINTSKGELSSLEISNTNKYLSTSISFQDNNDERHLTTVLWSVDSLKALMTLEDSLYYSAYYHEMKFSPDDSMLMTSKIISPRDLRVFDIESKKQIISTAAYSGNFLLDSKHLLLYYSDYDIKSRSELWNYEKSLNDLGDFGGRMIENVIINGEPYIFCSSGIRSMLYKYAVTSVHEVEIEKYSIDANATSILISNPEKKAIKQIIVTNLKGNSVLEYIPKDSYSEFISVENHLTNGVYICAIYSTDGKQVSLKFQVVR